jgi:hypothetical protein
VLAARIRERKGGDLGEMPDQLELRASEALEAGSVQAQRAEKLRSGEEGEADDRLRLRVGTRDVTGARVEVGAVAADRLAQQARVTGDSFADADLEPL